MITAAFLTAALVISGCTSLSRTPASPAMQAPIVAQPELHYRNGVRIQLLGISECPVQGKPWWRADGQLLAAPPYDVGKDPSASAFESLLLPWSAFALHVSNPQHHPMKSRVASSGSSEGAFMGNEEFETWQGPVCLKSNFMTISGTARLQFAVAHEPWQTLMKAGPAVGPFGIRGHVTGRILAMPSAENRGEFRFRLTHDFRDREARLVVVCADGRMDAYSVSEKDRGKDIAPVRSRAGYKPGEIREIQFQACRFEWKEFVNIPLHPKDYAPGPLQWVTVHTAELPFETRHFGAWFSDEVTFIRSRRDKDRTSVDVNCTVPAGRNIRVVAITTDGKLHPYDGPARRLANGRVFTHANFPDLPLHQVRAFALQVQTDRPAPAPSTRLAGTVHP